MTFNDATEYVFHETQKGTFVRKCYGLEELVSNMAEYCDGFTHLTVTASISFPTSVTEEELRKGVKAAWTALRRSEPTIACKTYRCQDRDRHFALRYTVPRAGTDVQTWLDETIFFSHEKKDVSLYEEHCRLKDGHWWCCSDDHYVVELHVSPMANGWAFSLVFSHNIIDGRNSYAVLDRFLGFLDQELRNEPTGINPDWGNEFVRLSPPGAFSSSTAKNGHLPTHVHIVDPPEDPSEEATVTHWFYPTRPSGHTGDTSRLIQFSEKISEELHEICKKKGCTITQVITALSALAHAEAALNTAGKAGTARFEEVAKAYYGATHYLVPWNFINQRPKLPADTSLALCTADCVPIGFPMDGIRSCIAIDGNTQSVIRTVDESAFWDVLVRDVSIAWKNLDQSLDGYAAREHALHNLCNNFTPQIFDLPALIVSSLGDLRRLDLLSSFAPSSDREPKTRLVVTSNDVICGIRIRTPPIMNIIWEYRGRITCHFMAGGEYTAPDDLALMTRAFEEWTEAMIQRG